MSLPRFADQVLQKIYRDGSNSIGVESVGTAPQVMNSAFLGTQVAIGLTQVEAKVGTSRLANRKEVYIENTSSRPIWYGPTGVTSTSGASLLPKQFVSINIGDQVAIYIISTFADAYAVVQEYA
jgi:hypothetical protein